MLRPGGAYLVVPGNGCDIPHLLATGTIIKDVHSGSKVGAALVAEWEARKRIQRHAPYAPRLFLHAVRARDEKHLYVCRNAPPAQPVASLSCDMCDAAYAYPSGFPAQCGNCHNRLLRFALS